MLKSKISLILGTTVMTLGLFIFVASCHKKDTTTTNTTEDTGYASDHNLAEKTYSDAQTIGDQGASVTSGSIGYRTTATTLSACATVTHSGDSVIVDFGPTDCTCLDGRVRRGKIITTWTGGGYTTTGSVHTITFDNYYVDDNHVTGTKTVTNMGTNSLGQPYFNVTIVGTITRTTGTVITANWIRVRTWLAGYTTSTWTDDSYSISGSGVLTRTPAGGSTQTVNVAISTATPLIVAYGCRYIEAGTVTYTLSTGATRSINFGTTAVCNNTATLTWENAAGTAGGSAVITLP